MSTRLAFVTSRLRVEEKLLLAELERRGADYARLDDGEMSLLVAAGAHPADRPNPPTTPPADVIWNRSLAFGRTLYTQRILEAQGALCVNPSSVVETCGDKVLTSIALERAGVPSLRTTVAFTPESALQVAEEFGYPVVLKPVVGSWGRLVARLDSRTAAEAVLEDRAVLGSWQQQVFYVQEYIEKPGRDARVFVIGDEVTCGIWRASEHWITNTARGGSVERCDVGGEVGEISFAAARAVGGGILAVDLVETPNGLAVIEVNHSGEFRNSIEPTGVDLPGAMVDYVLGACERGAL
ncbi:MAG: lysine biosynthesis protein LysX [bacterium]|nr:lysine biosynthesis protein LysX [bacterium]